MEAEHAVIGLPEAAVVNVHLIGCTANHLSLSHQGLVGQQLRSCASVSHDRQRLFLRKTDLPHLEGEENLSFTLYKSVTSVLDNIKTDFF